MAFIVRPRVKEACALNGTDPLTLTGAPIRHQTFDNVCDPGDTFHAAVEHDDADEWAEFSGTFNGSGQVEITTVIDGSAGPGNPVTFTPGTGTVWIDVGSSRMPAVSTAFLVGDGSETVQFTRVELAQGVIIRGNPGGFGLTAAIASVGGSHALDGPNTDTVVSYFGAGGDTITLPDAEDRAGRVLWIKNIGSGSVTLDATGVGQLFTTEAVNTLALGVGDAVTLISDDATWMVV